MAENTASDAPSADTAADLEPLSCVSCRAKKLKCDRSKPACARCVKVHGDCLYPQSRRKPTFKRKNVKELEARLAQVEGMLKDINGKEPSQGSTEDLEPSEGSFGNIGLDSGDHAPHLSPDFATDPFYETGSASKDGNHQQNSQLIGLGMTEALPPFEIIEDLHAIFFASAYHMAPVVHSGRYLTAFYGDPLRRPAMCLQNAIWALASHGHVKYDAYSDIFYRRARHYIEADEMRDAGEHFITLNHAQTWVILSTYEAKKMHFTRASMSCSRSVRICQMMGLDRLDGGIDDLPPALGPARSWIELEERRRVFWGAFAIDCHASISTGWPYLINAEDIMTRLPASEAAFSSGEEEKTAHLHQVFEGAPYAGFAGTIVTCQLFKSILRHVHRPKPDDNPADLAHGGFWKRHRELDNQLSSVFMFLPERFQLPANTRDPGAVHVNLNLHASIICLHHAALELAEMHHHSQSIIDESLRRLRTSAEEVVNIVKMTAHRTGIFKSPMCAIAMYCATTVYIYMAKTDPSNDISPVDVSNLEVIIRSMEAIGRSHQITMALLQQACHDIDTNGLSHKIRFPALTRYRQSGLCGMGNIPLFVRSSVSRNTEILPVLPGRLPLENPKGQRLDVVSRGSDATVRRLTGTDCYQPMIGAATRNIAGAADQSTVIDVSEPYANKRQRTSDSPLSQDRDAGIASMQNATAQNNTPGTNNPWKTGPNSFGSVFSLPDRSSPSNTSSPVLQNSATTATAARAASSSNESPAPVSGVGTSTVFGLGNTPAENRIDLRVFQDRMLNSAWPNQDDIFAAQITNSLIDTGEMPGGISMPWNFFTDDVPPWNGP
ncbi:Citrinin biosynthesis transcriptional activator mrl3 [Beauveria bassiana]|nr:Citrinin biosynthesis transcriptional activator mrl3 [Beauveria bassiana]